MYPINDFGNSAGFGDELSYENQEEVISILGSLPETSLSGKRKGEEYDLFEASADIEIAEDKPVSRRARKKSQIEPTPQQKIAGQFVQAARIGNFTEMQRLVEQGADVNEKVCGCTALMYASFYGRDEMAEYLLKLGAEVDESNLSGQTALLWAVERQHPSLVRMLIGAHSNVNVLDNGGLSALHKAVRIGSLDIVKLLVEVGKANASIQAASQLECTTPLHDAAFYGKVEIVQYLLEHGAEIDQRNTQGRNALHRAVYKNHGLIVQFLLDCGADVDARDNTERTALHWACFFGHREVLKILLEFGASMDTLDKSKLTPEDIARNRKHDAALQIFGKWKEQNPE